MSTSLIATIVFLLSYAAIATEKVNRTVVAFIGALLLLLFKVFTLDKAIGYVSWETMGLLLGMFIIVGALSEAGFFTYLALVTARMLKYSPSRIFIVFPIITGLLSGFMDSITVMLFFATLTFELCKILKIEATPLVITEVIMANIGGSMTLVGDPPNVILGLKLGFYFNDFVIHNSPIAIIAGAVTLFYCYMVNRKSLVPKEAIDKEELKKINPNDEIKDLKQLKIALAAFGVAIIFLITHTYIEKLTGIPLTVPLAALVPAFVMLIILGVEKSRVVITKVDYEVLLFFIGLFIIVGGLEQTGVIKNIAAYITNIFNGNHVGLFSTLLWGSGFASGIIDNVPFALSMSYVLQDIVKFAGVPALSIMLWATSLGTDIGGNFTPIGASANVVAYTSMEKKGLHIGWKRWLKLAVPATFISLIVCNLGLYIKYIIHFY